MKTWRSEQGATRTQEEPAHVVIEGRSALTRDGEGALVSAETAVTLDADISVSEGKVLTIRSDTRATLRRLGPADMSWARNVDPDALAREAELADAKSPRPVRKPSGQSADAILERSAKAHAARDFGARREAMRDLAATLRAGDAKALANVRERLLTAGVQGDELRTVVEALVSAGSDETWQLANELLADEATPSTARHSLAIGAGLLASAPDALIATLERLSRGALDDVGTAALWMLGSQANPERGRRGRVERLRTDLLDRASAALGVPVTAPSTPVTTVTTVTTAATTAGTAPAPTPRPPDDRPAVVAAWLRALGAAGGPEVWPLIAPFLEHASETVRHAAVASLTFVPGAAPRIALAERIQNDTSSWVRRRAVRTAGNLPEQAMEGVVARAIEGDRDPAVRLEAARVLAVWGVVNPGLNALVAHAAAREPDEQTAKMMRQLEPVSDTRAFDPGLGDEAEAP